MVNVGTKLFSIEIVDNTLPFVMEDWLSDKMLYVCDSILLNSDILIKLEEDDSAILVSDGFSYVEVRKFNPLVFDTEDFTSKEWLVIIEPAICDDEMSDVE